MSAKVFNLRIPDELSKEMQILKIIYSPTMKDIGILIMGENIEPHKIEELSIIRIYLLKMHETKLIFDQELEAFAFNNLESALDFSNNIQEMTALELLIMMNSFIGICNVEKLPKLQ